MQIYLWLYLVASLKMVTSKIVPLRLSQNEDEVVSPIFNHRRKTIPNGDFKEKLGIFLDLHDFDSKSSIEDLELVNNENLQLEDVDESVENDIGSYINQMKEDELLQLHNVLKELLEKPDPWIAPIFVIDEKLKDSDESLDFSNLETVPKVDKRSRFYRRYPWKRQNSRSRTIYEYDSSQHLCEPSKMELYELLQAVHNKREGTKIARRLRFCKRRKQPRTFYSNVRFIGRRK